MNTVTTKQILQYYWKQAYQYPRYVWGILLVRSLTALLFEFLPPLLVAHIINRLTVNDFKTGQLWQSFHTELIWYAIVSILGGVIIWRLFIFLNWTLETYVVRNILRESFAKLLRLDANFHANSFGGSLVSQSNKLAGAYVQIADAVQFQVFGVILSLILSTIILLPYTPWLVLAMWAITVVFFVLVFYFTKRTRELSELEAAKQNRTTGAIADAVTNVMAIKSFARESDENNTFAEISEDSRQTTIDVMRITTKKEATISSVTSSIQIVALVFAVASVVQFGAKVSTVFLVFTYMANVTQKLWEFTTIGMRNINRGIGNARDGLASLQRAEEVTDPAQPEKAQLTKGTIAFKDVTFTHAGNAESLFRNFSLEAHAGEKLGLVGHSGSGKTSLTKLLLRFDDIEAGEICIDGHNIAHLTQQTLRDAIAYVPQEPLLFHRSIRENIAYGKPSASEAEIVEAARQAHALEFIETLPNGFETLVGERGVKLSGGQRQRIAIARAMLKNAPILLLDEATSALDSESEVLIQAALWKLMEGRTAIVIAHRLSTIQKMDRILVLDDGKIVEEGSHAELVHKPHGTYAKLWAHQSGGFINE